MAVSILIDTNIIIYREDNIKVEEKLQKLFKILTKPDYYPFIHENSYKDINKDKDEKRREIFLSKMNSYQILETPYNFQEDQEFLNIVGNKNTSNDYVDNSLLYSLLKGEATFLITNDNEIHKKAKKLDMIHENFSERVFSISEALDYFKETKPISPYNINEDTMDHLDINDSIFDKLKRDYVGFEKWFEDKQKAKRECLSYYKSDDSLGAVLIYKPNEYEEIELTDKTLPYKNRLKIATMVVTFEGYKIGEFFLKWIINYSLSNNIEELYLTHFVEGPDDSLVYLIEEYGFVLEGNNSKGEAIYTKSINREECEKHISEEIDEKSPIELAKKYYPYFYDGPEVKKFIVPIIPEYHERLFLSKSQQSSLTNDIAVSRNSLKKAYLSRTRTKINVGDILLFYQTHANQGISEIGIVESSYKDLSFENIIETVGKRSVYSQEELKEYEEGHNSVLLFIHSLEFNKIPKDELNGIINGPPQTTHSIKHEKYLELKKMIP